eukprot:5262206-Pyramimonas_sp.AAC.1
MRPTFGAHHVRFQLGSRVESSRAGRAAPLLARARGLKNRKTRQWTGTKPGDHAERPGRGASTRAAAEDIST